MFLSLLHAEHEGWVGHVDVHLLDYQSLWAFTLVLVGALRVAFVLPRLLSRSLFCVTCSDVSHDVVDGFRNALLARTRWRTEDRHQCGLMLHIVDISEASAAEMGGKWWEDGLRYGWLIHLRRLRDEELDEARQLWGQFVDVIEIRVGVADVAEVSLLIVLALPLLQLVLAEFDGFAHDARHHVALLARASALHGGEGSLLFLAEDGDHRLHPIGVVVADVAEVTGESENEGVARTVLRFASQQIHELRDERGIGNAIVFLRKLRFRSFSQPPRPSFIRRAPPLSPALSPQGRGGNRSYSSL